MYDSAKGSFVDLSVLDVLQIFGRAGRPGLETSGEGYICTTEDKLAHYLDAVNSQVRALFFPLNQLDSFGLASDRLPVSLYSLLPPKACLIND